ncbi:MAG: hypothetical protein HYZ50_08460 [Deltaproteobacteria bacterium]|nr:hypothetical protein [Deltaproteobacteria bacterium]
MADRTAERIKFETEMLKLSALVAVATGGSSIGLLLGEHTALRLGLAGVGILTTLGLTVTVWRFYRNIRRLIAHIQESV